MEFLEVDCPACAVNHEPCLFHMRQWEEAIEEEARIWHETHGTDPLRTSW